MARLIDSEVECDASLVYLAVPLSFGMKNKWQNSRDDSGAS